MTEQLICQWLQSIDLKQKTVEWSVVEKWSREISDRYNEPQRHYHTLNHLSDMMGHLRTCKSLIMDHTSVLLAILFHDIVYDPKSKTNEIDSISIFKTFSSDVDLDEATTDKVTQMITATISHLPGQDSPDSDSDSNLFLDFDMAILGQPEQGDYLLAKCQFSDVLFCRVVVRHRFHNPKFYDEYADNIQKEYCHMSHEEFCKGRAKVLRTFLQRPRIYFSDKIYTMLEVKARKNLIREIQRLEDSVVQ